MTTGEVKTLLFADGIVVADPTPVQSAKRLPADTTNWNGATTTQVVYDVSSLNFPDAHDCLWFFTDGTNTQIGAKVTPTGNQEVTVTTGEVIPSGTYYLMGIY